MAENQPGKPGPSKGLKPPGRQVGPRARFSLGYVVLALAIYVVLRGVGVGGRATTVPYSQFRSELDAGRIGQVTLGPDRVVYSLGATPERGLGDGEAPDLFEAVRVQDEALVDDLIDAGVPFEAEEPPNGFLAPLGTLLMMMMPLLLIWFLLFRSMGAGRNSPMSMGKSRAKEIEAETITQTFADAGGVDAVEDELKEVIDFLKNPARYTALGAKLPTGVLLVGPPGTGKTLLARATAGEAGVPFFSMSGSEFVELFVGVGASRVRDLFDQAKERAPCIVFIDEIDAIGQSRARVSVIQSNDEREQTLNQLLYEMDGFEANNGVVILAATNRPDVLDKALLRAGRFDRQIEVPLPTEAGRRQILGIHSRHVSLGPDADLGRIARITASFSGADLANLVNEAALMAVRRGDSHVQMEDFDLAMERIVAGLQRDTPLQGEVRRRVAYHEAGHALVSELLPQTDPVHRVSIIPTSRGALGYTMEMPEEDRHLMGETELDERLTVMLGGRAAEALVFSEISTGAANDLERATELAKRMVTEFGMSPVLGPVRYSRPMSTGYLGPELATRPLSPETEALIDQEILRIVQGAEERASSLLRENQGVLDRIASRLQEAEVIEGAELRGIVSDPVASTLGEEEAPNHDQVEPGVT
ncbi:MAG: ATP-dependent zinc metalloprotease FtsH [Longimicrobiales bacterium]